MSTDLTLLEILVGMRELLASERRWTKHAYARGKGGIGLPHGFDPQACKWCLVGAFEKVVGRSVARDGKTFMKVAERLGIQGVGVATWQDQPERTHGEILAALDRAIELERSAA